MQLDQLTLNNFIQFHWKNAIKKARWDTMRKNNRTKQKPLNFSNDFNHLRICDWYGFRMQTKCALKN